ncbi:MAG: tRNA (guanosine(46)-N7)-methyltransferase TrmB [Candidatus Lambdaproteobacteria bacterium]|nr:tRNA (guanosine(46)-N7)-methyltransferase TrmB [Candidatus Lambdaproteobacteria bacterium]
MRAPATFAADINPYARWVYDHPATLLAAPTPAALEALRAARPLDGGRLHVELGCGAGNFLKALSRRQPGDHFVGFELRFKRLVKAARKIEREGLANVWLLRERAEECCSYFVPGTVDAVYLNFPDPWPKAGQWKKRLVQAAFLDRLARCLKPGGRFELKTDHSGYFLHVLALVWNRAPWRLCAVSNDLHRQGLSPGLPVTEFEQLFVAKRKPVHQVTIVRAD